MIEDDTHANLRYWLFFCLFFGLILRSRSSIYINFSSLVPGLENGSLMDLLTVAEQETTSDSVALNQNHLLSPMSL